MESRERQMDTGSGEGRSTLAVQRNIKPSLKRVQQEQRFRRHSDWIASL